MGINFQKLMLLAAAAPHGKCIICEWKISFLSVVIISIQQCKTTGRQTDGQTLKTNMYECMCMCMGM